MANPDGRFLPDVDPGAGNSDRETVVVSDRQGMAEQTTAQQYGVLITL
jgi:hypothetical protein